VPVLPPAVPRLRFLRSADSVARPTRPSTVRLRAAWKRLTEARVAGPKPPSTEPGEKPRLRSMNWRPATSQPRWPLRITREPSFGRPRLPSARRVLGPAMPSGASLRLRWNRFVAATVLGPRMPSIEPP
jgi:hypothetical protein